MEKTKSRIKELERENNVGEPFPLYRVILPGGGYVMFSNGERVPVEKVEPAQLRNLKAYEGISPDMWEEDEGGECQKQENE